MFGFLLILILIVCVLLILIVLIQNSKGGGLTSNLSSSNQMMGVRQTADFLEKATWTLATVLLVLSLIAGMTAHKKDVVVEKKSKISDQLPEGYGYQNAPNYASETETPAQE